MTTPTLSTDSDLEVVSAATPPKGRPAWVTPLALGLLTTLTFYLSLANRLVLTIDEGTFLTSGNAIFHGAVPYRDFFANTGPGNFWLLALIFRVAGVSLRSAHLLLALDLGVIIGLTWWLASKLAGTRSAVAVSVLCIALFLSSPTHLVTNHRWDANAFALAAIVSCLGAIDSGKRAVAFLAGLFVVCAAWVTPPVGLLAVVLALRLWRRALPFFVGAALAGAVPAAWLASQGGLRPMLDGLLWNASHYSGSNLVPYGFLIGGPAALFTGAHGIEYLPRLIFALSFLLPAILPIAAAIAWLPSLRHPSRTEPFLLLCGVALVASNYPRCDLGHLVYTLPVFLVLAAVWLQRHAAGTTCAIALIVPLLPALAMDHQNLAASEQTTLAAAVGPIRIPKTDTAVPLILNRIKPGDTLFVFPYEPIFYFLTQAHNPTRYPWLQPGMMSEQDERAALAGLIANPPEWILYRDLPPTTYLRIWPGADSNRLRMSLIEDFIQANYTAIETAQSPDGPRKLLRRR